MMIRTPYRARVLCVAAMFAALGNGAALAQATGAQSGSSGNAPAADANSATATGSMGRTDNRTDSSTDRPTGRDATRKRTHNDRANPSGEYVPRAGSSSHQDKNGNVVKDQSTGGSPQGRERPPATAPNIPATQP
ncbi:hypothetical protein [Ralstonia sp. SET104]|uniref:hypothetical protein n=1 Tax=Ralstonia sp. SET104 TaxID=2448774 RepID=UPI000F57367C|nr:hypothetical protein [Ralstonia sp. SET104]